MKLQPYLRKCLWAGGLLIVILLVTGTLWLALATAGDQAGSQAARGIALVAIVCLILDLVILIILLAVAEISRPDPHWHSNDRPPSEGPRP